LIDFVTSRRRTLGGSKSVTYPMSCQFHLKVFLDSLTLYYRWKSPLVREHRFAKRSAEWSFQLVSYRVRSDAFESLPHNTLQFKRSLW